MTEKTPTTCGSDSSKELGLLPIGPHDHPEPRTMMWSALELAAIKEYAARCVAAERERCAKICDALAKQSSGINARLPYRAAATAIRGEQPTATQDVPPENRPDSWWRWHI